MSDPLEATEYVCERCAHAPVTSVPLPFVLDDLVQTMPPRLLDALADCARCLAHDGVHIDRAHVEAVHTCFGAFAIPLEPWLAERAVVARPELAGAALLVVDVDATIVDPAENWQRRLDALRTLEAPEVVIAQARASLERARAHPVSLEWERVAAWPCPSRFPGTTAFGAIAKVMAEHALPPLVGAHAWEPIRSAIDRAIDELRLDASFLSYRHALSNEPAHTDLRARGLELAVRFLDELGHTDLRTNQDTLVDDCHFTLASAGLAAEAASVHRTWLEVAIPRALRLVSSWPSDL